MNGFLDTKGKLHECEACNIAQELIEKAKIKYPVSIPYKGKLTEEDITELERVCDVRCPSIYMDGSGYYYIRYRKDELNETSRYYGY